jgi:hypothetical protein
MNVKNQQLLWDPICGYYNESKKPAIIMGPICGYYIFENGIMEFTIKNNLGIICLKCVLF